MKRLLVPAALLLAASCGSDTTTASTTQPESIPTTVPETASPSAPTDALEGFDPTAGPTPGASEPTVVSTEPSTAPTSVATQIPAQLPTATPAPTEPTAQPAPTDTQALNAALAAARSRWQANRPDQYSMTYHLECNCDQGPWRVSVDGNRPDLGEHLAPGPNAAAPPFLLVEDIYLKIGATSAAGSPVEYDFDELGIPRVFSFDGPDEDFGGPFRLVIDEFLPDDSGTEPGEDRSADRQVLSDAISLWEAAGLVDYDYIFRRPCFCAPEYVGPYAVSVLDGVVVGATYDAVDLLDVEALRLEQYSPHVLTVTQVFAEIDEAIERAASYTMEFHPELGYPTDVYIDWDKRMADEEIGYQIEGLVSSAG